MNRDYTVGAVISMDENSSVTHQEALKVIGDTVSNAVRNDPFLRDLPDGVTVEELEGLIAVEYGQSVNLEVEKFDGTHISVVVSLKGTVRDLKLAIQRCVQLNLSREGKQKHISWRHIWKTYSLSLNNTLLSSDHSLLKSYGVRNKDVVKFVRKLRQKN